MPEIVGTLKPPRLASSPGSPALGQIFYDTVTNQLKVWNGTVWVVVGFPADVVIAAATRILTSELLAADSQPAFRIMGDGKIEWGPGGSTAPDTNLYRLGASILATDDALQVGGTLAVLTFIQNNAQALFNYILAAKASGDANNRFTIQNSGHVAWGDGTAVPDILLYRGSADTLKTDDQFHAVGGLTTKTKAGVPTDADTALDADGTIIADTTNERLYLRVGGAWKYTKLGLTDPAAGGVDYKGAWDSGTAYIAGDVVNYGGLEWLAVNPGTNQVPGAAVTAAVGTALPASPVDGQEFTLVDSLTAPTYAWRFRYVASISDAYKWLFVGGSHGYSVVATSESRNANTYGALTTAGPSFTIPRAGIYDITISSRIDGVSGSANAGGWMSYDIGGTAAVDLDALSLIARSGNTNIFGSAAKTKRKTLAASTALVAKYRNDVASDVISYVGREMFIHPVRVS